MPLPVWARDAANRLVLRKHHLARSTRAGDVLAVARDLLGLHATDPASPDLQLRARMRTFGPEKLDVALHGGRVAKVPGMRATLFIQAADLIPLVMSATWPVFSRGRDRYLDQNGLSAGRYRQLSDRVARVLAGRAMDARQVRQALGTPETLSAVLHVMCDEARIVRWRGRRGWRDPAPGYRLFKEALPGVHPFALQEAEAVRRLVRLYLLSYGPVTEGDVAWWTGLGRGVIRTALAALGPEAVALELEGVPGRYLAHAEDLEGRPRIRSDTKPEVSLLPILDPYLQGYCDRVRYLDPGHRQFVFDRGGNSTSVVLVDGRVAGVWDAVTEPRPEVRIFLFGPPPRAVHREALRLAAETGTFVLGEEVPVVEVGTMTPLTQRGGWVGSPLRHSAGG